VFGRWAGSDATREPDADGRRRSAVGYGPGSIARSPPPHASRRAAQTSVADVAMRAVPPQFHDPRRYSPPHLYGLVLGASADGR
jgi:hypothetical protein